MSILRKLFGFCCCSTVDCDICADNFNRSDSTDISTGSACGWTETAGNATIESNALKFTTTLAKATCNSDATVASRAIRVKALGTNSNNIARVHVGDWVVDVTFSASAGRLRIINPVGSVAAATDATFNVSLNTFHDIVICCSQDRIAAVIDDVTGTFLTYGTGAIADLTNGLGTGSTVSGSVQFDDWQLSEVSDDCPCEIVDTVSCATAALPQRLALYFPAAPSNNLCNCSVYNGATVYLDYVGRSGTNCLYRGCMSSSVPDYNTFTSSCDSKRLNIELRISSFTWDGTIRYGHSDTCLIAGTQLNNPTFFGVFSDWDGWTSGTKTFTEPSAVSYFECDWPSGFAVEVTPV